MQVKKFEARSMKEALEMVKRQLGPDAIILSARDHRRSFGLVGDGSVEITAAVAEETLHKKRFAESRMKPELREKFLSAPARTQRMIMDQFVQQYQEETPSRPVTSRRYVEIEDEGMGIEANAAESRIRDAAQRAWDAMRAHEPAPRAPEKSSAVSQAVAVARAAVEPVAESAPKARPQPVAVSAPAAAVNATMAESAEILSLKAELEGLKKVLTEFQKVPQTFVGQYPGARYGLNYEMSATFEKLIQAGVAEDLAAALLERAQADLPVVKQKSRGLVDGWVARQILETTPVTGSATKTRVHCFVGTRGVGKTSALVKMASHAVVEEGRKVALLTTDVHKVGAVDQMRIYTQILNVPFGVVKKPEDWQPLLRQIADYDLILCDFPGMSLKTAEEIASLRRLLGGLENPAVHLVLSACAKDSEVMEIGRRYQAARYSDFIFNHLDEALAHGTIYNVSQKFEKPLHSFGTGPRVPEDFEYATRERVLDLIFKLSKLKRTQELS